MIAFEHLRRDRQGDQKIRPQLIVAPGQRRVERVLVDVAFVDVRRFGRLRVHPVVFLKVGVDTQSPLGPSEHCGGRVWWRSCQLHAIVRVFFQLSRSDEPIEHATTQAHKFDRAAVSGRCRHARVSSTYRAAHFVHPRACVPLIAWLNFFGDFCTTMNRIKRENVNEKGYKPPKTKPVLRSTPIWLLKPSDVMRSSMEGPALRSRNLSPRTCTLNAS